MQTRTPLVAQRESLQKADRFIPGGCLGMIVLPTDLRMVMVRGQGSKVYDAAGKEYLDYMLGSGPLLLGHCRPEVVEAVQREAARGSTYFALNEPAIRLAEIIVDAVPCGEAIRFQTTGSEATFAAMRLARAFTGRDKVLKFEGVGTAGTTSANCPAHRRNRRPSRKQCLTATAFHVPRGTTC